MLTKYRLLVITYYAMYSYSRYIERVGSALYTSMHPALIPLFSYYNVYVCVKSNL